MIKKKKYLKKQKDRFKAVSINLLLSLLLMLVLLFTVSIIFKIF